MRVLRTAAVLTALSVEAASPAAAAVIDFDAAGLLFDLYSLTYQEDGATIVLDSADGFGVFTLSATDCLPECPSNGSIYAFLQNNRGANSVTITAPSLFDLISFD